MIDLLEIMALADERGASDIHIVNCFLGCFISFISNSFRLRYIITMSGKV